ncbi:MAG: hypothetical protein H6679_02300 [Epsilonproteobacteria bacterium]|nr:hypothetical protein [Campylobacterota bacterium]
MKISKINTKKQIYEGANISHLKQKINALKYHGKKNKNTRYEFGVLVNSCDTVPLPKHIEIF